MISSSNKIQHSFLKRILALPIVLFVIAIASVSVKAQTVNTVTGKKLQKSNLQPVTVRGQKLAVKPEQEPVTVSGKKLQKSNLQPVTDRGYELAMNSEQEPVTVSGKKLQNSSLQPVTVRGHKLDLKPEQEPITVTGRKSAKKAD